MASDPRARGALPPGRSGPFAAVRRTLFRTVPGRLLVIGGAVKLVTWLLREVAGVNSALVDAVGSIGSLAVIVALVYFVSKLVGRARRRLLWRVRRKLILSYIFVGVVPVLLVVGFFLLAALLLFLNVGSYLATSRLRSVTEYAQIVAQHTASEISRDGLGRARDAIERERATLAKHYPGVSMALVPTPPEPCRGAAVLAPAGTATPRAPAITPAEAAPAEAAPVVTVGPWSHLPAPHTLPAWVSCSGFAGFVAVAVPAGPGEPAADKPLGLVIRSVAVQNAPVAPSPDGRGGRAGAQTTAATGRGKAAAPRTPLPGFAVIVDIPLDTALKARIRDDTTVKIDAVYDSPRQGDVARPAAGAGASVGDLIATLRDDASPKRRFPFLAVVEWVDWPNGATGQATINIQVNVADIFERMSAEQSGFDAGRRAPITTGGALGINSVGVLIVGMLALLAVLFVIIEVVALVMGLVLARSITGSVHQLFTGTERVRQGDFGHKIRIASDDQMGQLADSFNSMTASIEDLLRQAEEKKRLEEELRIARAIQMSLLPRGQLTVPGLSITALCVPAREVGGDYYDLLPLADGRLGVLIADVAGKGTSAALYMAELKGLILSLSRIYTSPRQLLIEANRIISDNLDSRSFITVAYAVLDLQARVMTYARAGHTPLVHRSGDGGGVDVLTPDGLVVGLQMDDGGRLFERLLKEVTIPIRDGDLFLFFTDGITEAMNAASDCFGESRLGEILAEHGDLPSEELRERILREIDAFVAGAPQHDDMTMILLKVEAIGAARAADAAALSQPVGSRA